MLIDSFGFGLIFIVTLCLAVPLGAYMKRVYHNDSSFLDFILPLEKWIFKICRIDPKKSMNWKQYLLALLFIQVVWVIPAFIVLMLQGKLFLNPAHITGMDWSLALNSAISFLTSTNLQHYVGETGASYLSQIGVFTYLQFVSAATSLAAGVAIVRGLTADPGTGVGNFFSDLLRSCTRILLPLSIIVAFIFMIGGMPMTFNGPHQITTLQGDTVQVATGPVAAMVPIKELGSNGGGFFGANDAHPFENPTFITFIVHFIIVLLLPMAFVFFIGYYLNQKKFAWMLFGVMTAGLLLLIIPIVKGEAGGNLKITAMGIDRSAGNMEGKEVRFGAIYSAYYCAENIVIPAGTAVSVHDSYMPLSATAMLIGMQIDAFFGGLGTGWINMFMYLVIAVFIGTLMIGRSPELFGKKISTKEMQVAVMVNVFQIFVPLVLAAIACFVYVNKNGGGDTLSWLSNKGPHGFTTMLYEYVSSVAGNGSNFGGLGNNTPFWNLTTAVAMLSGRFVPIIGGLMIVGLMKAKKFIPASSGTLQTDSATFGVFLLSIILVLSALSLFVILMAGPITEHFSL
ncbi:K+-transporting ATPase ATPase A chain [Mucilaginibacter lappiensis]|uniref:Potassium-transporting ATPase potassium-binding subunit n=1 Tax=Mucilaginibacter lappiensis TaxID=354630 RepID=A0ABR6PJT1_9SPHI|nr:potassium-transporting ATPase subunit KdpA [Mucilaginibacter lappiensis]MBB6109990.1 K+-transporting ATPase ATPase A chain [Mucilaginibacter lappiensis]SIR56042.1 K+-transporting ATPase ATPase A chain [Mucilaginibacter lappiensis]